MIRLVGAPGGAEAGESRLLVWSGLLGRLGMNNFYCSYRVLVSRVPRQATYVVPRTLPGRSALVHQGAHVFKPAHKSEPGSRIRHCLPHRCDTRGKCMTQSCSLCFLQQWLYKLQVPGRSRTTAAGESTIRKSSHTYQHPCPSHREQPFLLFASLAANHCGSK